MSAKKLINIFMNSRWSITREIRAKELSEECAGG